MEVQQASRAAIMSRNRKYFRRISALMAIVSLSDHHVFAVGNMTQIGRIQV